MFRKLIIGITVVAMMGLCPLMQQNRYYLKCVIGEAWAADTTWGFDSAGDYTYDTNKIEITGGVARLKASGLSLKDDTIAEYNSSKKS